MKGEPYITSDLSILVAVAGSVGGNFGKKL
jgi:hypothetical protein